MTFFERETTTVRIPQQRFGSRQNPVVVVVPEQLTWRQRLAFAIGRAAWKRRRVFLPFTTSVACLLATAVAHATAPRMWAGLAFIAVSGPAWLAWAERQHPADNKRVRTWRYVLAAAVLVVGAWAAACIAFGPFTSVLPLVWLLLTITGHVLWLRTRRTTANATEETV
ncbi:hypothetical protein [Streptomyces sp. NPDC001404]|uniref:hypothetical protein n=1 Tax=Streptomyces sp. NPDC001404 TaxID=3364571 RepID=UPI00369C04D1